MSAKVAITISQSHFCQKMESDIKRFGVDQALSKWHVVCDYMQTEDGWPAIVREVEKVIDAAYEERNRRQDEKDSRQAPAPFQLNLTQHQGELRNENNFADGSNSQVFNGMTTGKFK